MIRNNQVLNTNTTVMAPSSFDSFRYALRQELLILYTLILGGSWLQDVSHDIVIANFGIFHPDFLDNLVQLPIRLVGFILVVGGSVGVIHNVLTDLH